VIETTLGAVLDREFKDWSARGIYVVSDGDLVLYVGKSRNPLQRLWEHVNKSFAGIPTPSSLGEIALDCEPESDAWTVRLYLPTEFGSEDLELAELEAIRRLRPCVNQADNRNAPKLPRKYYGEMWREKRRRHRAEMRSLAERLRQRE
jgi:hypothetical protein